MLDPRPESPFLAAEDALAYARYGMVHRALYTSSAMTLGTVHTAAWSDVWGGTSRTADSTTLSFPRHPYVIDIPERHARVVAAPGMALLVNPCCEFRRDAAYRADVGNDFLTIAPSVVADALRERDPSTADRPDAPFPDAEARLDADTFRLHRLLVAYLLATDDPDPLVVEDVAYAVLRRVLERAAAGRRTAAAPRRKSTADAHRRIVAAAQEFIVAHLFERLRLPDVAEHVGMAPAHLCGVFRREAGRSVHGYVRELRLRAAHDRLPECSGNLSDLALEVGFSHASHFSHAFRQHFGEPPSSLGERLRARDPGALLDELARLADGDRGGRTPA